MSKEEEFDEEFIKRLTGDDEEFQAAIDAGKEEGKKEELKEDINIKFETLRHELIEAINNQGKKDTVFLSL